MSRVAIRKAQPTPGDAHVNAPLTNISVAFLLADELYVADKVFPAVPVAKQSDLFYEYSKEDFLRDEARPRAPGTESAGGGFGLSTKSYSCVVEAYHKDVDDQLRSNADSVLQLDRAATEFVTQKLMIRRERRWATSFFASGIWGTDFTPGTLWSAANSTPRQDVDTAKETILQNTGLVANTAVMGVQVFKALRSHADVRDQFKYTSADSIDEQMLARFFGLERVLVAKAIYNSAIEGAAGSYAFIAGKHCLICHTTPSPSVMTPTAGYQFVWSGLVGSSNGMRIKRFRMEHLESDRIEGQMAYDMKVVASACGYFFASVVA